MLQFVNCDFEAKGANNRDKVFGLTIDGAEDALVDNCSFGGTGYAAIHNVGSGKVTIKNCKFDCENYYNPVENSLTVPTDDMVIDSCNFENHNKLNNFINFYNVKDGSTHTVKNCHFTGSVHCNIVRLSNATNVSATFNIEDSEYAYIDSDADDYTAFMLLQDYTGNKGQDFSKYTVNVKNVNKPANSKWYYVYDDKAGIITDNNPQFFVDGVAA